MKKILFTILALTLFLVACSEDESQNAEPEETVTPVEVEQVTKDNLVVEKNFYGRSMAEATTPVVSQAVGEVDSVEVKKGDQVEEGDVLVKITRADGYGQLNIEAPADGEVTTLNASEGGIVSNSEPFATIVDLENVTIQVAVTAENLKLFNDNEEATISFTNIEEEKTATIEYVSSVSNETGLYPVELSIENEDKEIKPGMVAVIHLPENKVEDVLLIPTNALVEEGDETFVYVVKEDTAVKTEINVVQAQTDFTAIEGELSEGDTVITSGQLTLSDGSKVSIMEEE